MGVSRQGLRGFLGDSTAMTQTIETNATPPIRFNDPVYDDMQFPAMPSEQGANEKPDFDYTNIGFQFPQNDETEIIYLSEQFSHSRKQISALKPHIHFIQTSSSIPVWVMQYRWYDLGESSSGDFVSIETSGSAVFPYTSGNIMQITTFPDIEATGIIGTSSWWECKIYRKTGDGVTGDVLYKSFDIHYAIDTVGSDQIYTKTG